MVLLLAVAAGLTAGLLRSWAVSQPYQTRDLNLVWLVFAAVIPQLVAFHLPRTAALIPDQVASWTLVLSQLGLLIFSAANLKHPGFWLLFSGITLNLIVITANGGWMPISTKTIQVLHPEHPLSAWNLGGRLGHSKNILLFQEQIRFRVLADRFPFPDWFPWPRAFSLGDALLAAGAFLLLWKPDRKSWIEILIAKFARPTGPDKD
jgi:hypothetical protein